MKCPKCGNEIANDSLFCEFCGTQVGKIPLKVSSTLLAWIMFLLVICLSAAEMSCIECLNRAKIEDYCAYVATCTVTYTFLLVALANLSVCVISIILAIKKQLQKATSIILCLMSSLIALGAVSCAFSVYTYDDKIFIDDSGIYYPISIAAILAGVYVFYELVSKTKHKNLTK